MGIVPAFDHATDEGRVNMSYNAIAFYITAHEDDWELFRGELAYADAQRCQQGRVHPHDGGRRGANGWMVGSGGSKA